MYCDCRSMLNVSSFLLYEAIINEVPNKSLAVVIIAEKTILII